MLNDNFGKPCLIVFKFGWSQFVHDKQKYLGLGPNNTLNFPGQLLHILDEIEMTRESKIPTNLFIKQQDHCSPVGFLLGFFFSRHFCRSAGRDMKVCKNIGVVYVSDIHACHSADSGFDSKREKFICKTTACLQRKLSVKMKHKCVCLVRSYFIIIAFSLTYQIAEFLIAAFSVRVTKYSSFYYFYNCPGLSSEVMEWITTSFKNVIGIGVDTSSVDPGASTDMPVHRLGSAAGLYNIENVNLSMSIPGECLKRIFFLILFYQKCVTSVFSETGCTALVMPMKIAKGTGAPVRFIAICPKQAAIGL